MKDYRKIEQKISSLRENEDKIKDEWVDIVNTLKADNVQLDIELDNTKRKLTRKCSELSELKVSHEKLLKEYMLLKMEKLRLEQMYLSATGENMPIQHGSFVTQEQYKEEKENHKKKIKEMDGIIKTLRDKLGNKTVPLTVIVDEIKKKAKMAGIDSAYQLFETFNLTLSDVPAWKSNKSALETFFIEERERTLKALNVNIQNGATAQISEQSIINNHLDNPKLLK